MARPPDWRPTASASDREWRLTAQLSNAFRAPSFNDLYFPGFGNPDLAPERAVSGELGLQYAAGDATARAGLFRTDTRDLIVFDPASARAENIDKARVTGFELGGLLAPRHLVVRGERDAAAGRRR